MYKLIRPLIFTQDPETMHNLFLKMGVKLARSPVKSIINSIYHFEDSRLEQTVFNTTFKNPIGLAAGFDKNGKLSEFLPALGFGFTEIGSVTARAGTGNPKPRMFRLTQDKAVINRMGLNNEGVDAVMMRLHDQHLNIPAFVNIAKTHDPTILEKKAVEDFTYSFVKAYPYALGLIINVSCPNTAEGKTFEETDALQSLLVSFKNAETKLTYRKPILLKFSPDLPMEKLDALLTVAKEFNVAGYVIANCTANRPGLTTSPQRIKEIGRGGLSGRPIEHMTTEVIRHIYTTCNKPLIIGLGGVFSAQDAYEKIKAGASLIELYTGLVYEGPALVKKIKKGLVELLERDGYATIKDAVGISVL